MTEFFRLVENRLGDFVVVGGRESVLTHIAEEEDEADHDDHPDVDEDRGVAFAFLIAVRHECLLPETYEVFSPPSELDTTPHDQKEKRSLGRAFLFS